MLEQDGYVVIPDALSAEEIASIKSRLLSQARAERETGVACMDGGKGQSYPFTAENGGVNQRVFMLANKGREFWSLIDHPATRDLIASALGRHYLLSSLQANIVNQGGQAMPLHIDQWWLPCGCVPVGDVTRDTKERGHVSEEIIAVCNTLFMLTDFTADNGATVVVPGSHVGDTEIVADQIPPIPITGSAGSVLVYDGRLVHGAGENRTSEPRIALLANYCGPQFRQQECYHLGGFDSHAMTTRQKELMGLLSWHGYGRAENVVGMFDPEKHLVGRLGD